MKWLSAWGDWALLAAALLLLVLTAATASAESLGKCAPRSQIVERLAAQYHEAPIGLGLGSNGGAVELFVSTETGTWTITLTLPDGMTCLVAAGLAWETMQARAEGDDA